MQYKNDDRVKNISYINKDFQSLWAELLEIIPKFTNKWDPQKANESDPLAVLLKVLAIFSDKLNYNIDKSILERFPQTLTQLRSAYNVYDTLGYKPPWYRSAVTSDMRISYTIPIPIITNDGKQNTYKDVVEIPKFTMVSNEDKSIIYTLLGEDINDSTIQFVGEGGEKQVKFVKAIQGAIKSYKLNNGNTTQQQDRITLTNLDSHNRLYFLEPNIAQNGIYISSTGKFDDINEWVKVDNIFSKLDNPKVYEFGIDPISGACYIEFPETIASTIGEGVYIKYIISDGSNGNIKANTISQFYDNLSYEDILKNLGNSTIDNAGVENSATFTINDLLEVTNDYAITNGTEPATLEEMYNNYRRVKGTFSTLVTLLDYENFIYTYENALGNNLVSNIKVTDRSNDLYDTYKYWELTTDGVENLVTASVNGESSGLNAFALRLYPLDPATSGVSDKNSYNTTFQQETFKQINGGKKISYTTDIEKSLENSKCILHDFTKNIGSPIFVDCDIKGQIYLKTKVSSYEANELKNKIDNVIYDHYNSRKLTFGEEISYRELLDLIKNSDDRIDYVALNPIEYNNATINTNGDKEEVYPQLTLIGQGGGGLSNIAKQRAILSGNVPWVKTNSIFSYFPDQQTTGVIANIKNLTPTISFSDEAKEYKILENESFSLFAPKYVDKTIYTNFLFYTYTGNNISANTPYTLGSNETITFYEERDSSQVRGTLTKGNSIRSNFDITPTTANNRVPLSNGKQIVEIGKKDEPIASGSNILFLTNSQRLADALRTGISYTLLPTEFAAFKRENQSSLIIIEEGNTLYSHINLDNIYVTNESSDGISSNNTWSQATLIDGNAINCIQNEIYTFTNGYSLYYRNANNEIISLKTGVNNGINWSELSNFTIDKTPQILAGNNISYNLYYKGAGDSEEKAMPTLLTGDSWRGFPSFNVTLNSIEGFPIKKDGEHKQILKYSANDADTGSIDPSDDDNNPKYVEASTFLSLVGGVETTIPNGVGLSLLSFQAKLNSPITTKQGFTKISSLLNNNNWTTPGTSNQFVLFNIWSPEANDIGVEDSTNAYQMYSVLAKGNFGIGFKKGTKAQISNNMLVLEGDDAYGYKRESIKDLISSNNAIVLRESAIYNERFNPLHTISNRAEIDTEINASYFNKNHPLNSFALPRINSLENLIISEESKKN